jgi:flagellar motility protein MotE (MotC chaperone)
VRSIRLLPIVIFATFALFVLKGIGLLTDGGYALLGTEIAAAQDAGGNGQTAAQGADANGEMSDAVKARNAAAADRASETLFAREENAPTETDQIDAVPITETNLGEKVEIGSSDGTDQTERAVLERLGERRTTLEIREQELDARAALVEAAELRLAERIAGLEALEQRINALVEEKKALDNAQFAGVVGMYETMKPADAASIFDSLDMPVLLRVARSMNPRKMAPVLAKMETKRATDLTSLLAEIEPEPQLNADVNDLSDLPQIVGK